MVVFVVGVVVKAASVVAAFAAVLSLLDLFASLFWLVTPAGPFVLL